MRRHRFERLLTASALAVIFAAASSITASAGITEERAIEAAIPVPEAAGLPPPALMDLAPSPAGAELTAREIEGRVPLPESADLPPPSLKDVGATGSIQQTKVPEAPVATRPATGATTAPLAREIGAPAAAPAPATAPPAEVTPPVAAPVAAPENPVAAAMREFIVIKLPRLVERKNERSAIEALYAKRGYEPLWTDNGEASARAKAAIRYLASVDAEGLDPAEYPTPVFRSGADPAALAEADVKMTTVVLTFARHAQGGRVHWSRVSNDIQYNHQPAEPADLLAKIADAKDMAATLADFNPPHAGYRALKEKLAELRGQKEDSRAARIGDGPVLKIGMQDNRVPLVRARLAVAGDPNDATFDKDVAEAVKKFQQERKLKVTGTLTAATVEAMNGGARRSSARDIDIVLANMERWRWLPRDLSNADRAHVILNIPDYTLRVYHHDKVAWQTRVVVGATKTPTPIVTEAMKYITVNPTWNVPPSIVYNEYLPALQQDPTVLARMGLRVSQNRDGSIHVSQPPGEKNALGRIRFNFPNRFLVYQHDTPDKHYFAHEKRAYSHGCQRVQDPARYAEVLLGIARPNDGYTQDRIRRMFGTTEQDIQLPNPIPVHITYQTAFVDDAGKLQFREDVYGRDSRLVVAMKSEERRVADVAVEQRKQSYARPAVNLPYGAVTTPIHGGGSYAGGPSFFDMLFGGGGQPRPRTPVQRRTTAR